MSTDLLRSHLSSVIDRIEGGSGKQNSKDKGGGNKVVAAQKSSKRDVGKHKAGKEGIRNNNSNNNRKSKSKIEEAVEDLKRIEKKKARITYYYKTGMPMKKSKNALGKRIRALKN